MEINTYWNRIAPTTYLVPLKAEAASFRYTVRPGDTIFKLSQRFYVSQEEIIKINGLKILP